MFPICELYLDREKMLIDIINEENVTIEMVAWYYARSFWNVCWYPINYKNVDKVIVNRWSEEVLEKIKKQVDIIMEMTFNLGP